MNKILKILLIGVAMILTGCGHKAVVDVNQVLNQPKNLMNNIYYYLPVDQTSSSYSKALVPANSKILECGAYLTMRNGIPAPFTVKTVALQSALNQELMIKMPADSFYYNPLVEHAKIKVDSVSQTGEVMNVALSGEFTTTGDKCGDQVMKGMIQETIKEYTQKYTVTLNGSESNWQCLFNDSKECVK